MPDTIFPAPTTKKVTGTGYQWYVNSGSNVPYGVATVATASVDTFTAWAELKAAADQDDLITHVLLSLNGVTSSASSQGLLQIATGASASEVVKSTIVWNTQTLSTYRPTDGIVISLPFPVAIASGARIAVRVKYSRTNGSSLTGYVNLGYVAASDLGDF